MIPYSENHNMINLSIFCSVFRVRLKLDIPDLINPFTRFILWARSKNYSINYIANTIELSEETICTECNYLKYIRFMDNQFNLTDEGKIFVERCEIIDTFNKKNFGIFINGFTGEIESVNVKLLPSAIQKLTLPEKINLKVLQQSNTYFLRNAVEDILHHEFGMYDNEFFSSIKVRTNGNPEHCGFIEYCHTASSETEANTPIYFISDVGEFQFKAENQEIGYYRHAISTLEAINTLDEELLSAKSKNILEKSLQEKIIQNRYASIFYDFVDAEFCGENICKDIKNEGGYLVIESSEMEYDKVMKKIMKECPSQYSLNLIDMKIHKKIFTLPFSSFERV